MLYGAGKLGILSKDLDATSLRGEQLLMPACIAQFELTPDVNLAEAKCLTDGTRQITAAQITEEIWTLNLTYEKAGWNEIGFALDELPQLSTGVDFPLVKTAIVDAAGEIIDADIAIADDIRAYEDTPIQTFLMRVVSPAVPVDGEFLVDAGKLVFPVSKAGAVITYNVTKTYSSIETIGKETDYDKFGRLIFTGEIYTTEDSLPMQIQVHQLSRISTPALSINGDLSELAIEFRAGVVPGQRKPFTLYRRVGAVV